MGWRTIIIDTVCKVAYKNGYIVLKKEVDSMIHLSEIDVVVLATTQITFTCIAINELVKNKIKIIFCDEKHNPLCEITPYYGAHNTSKKLQNQINWDNSFKNAVIKEILKQKILNQASVLKKHNKTEEYNMLYNYACEIVDGDATNREGHSAKVYFNALFGMGFTRLSDNAINSALDYGYTILLSYINREVVLNGCVTQIGIKHCNEFNEFNLSCDIIEPFRPIIDDYILTHTPPFPLEKDYKYQLIGLLSLKVNFNNQNVYLSNAISQSVKSIIDALDSNDLNKIKLYEF